LVFSIMSFHLIISFRFIRVYAIFRDHSPLRSIFCKLYKHTTLSVQIRATNKLEPKGRPLQTVPDTEDETKLYNDDVNIYIAGSLALISRISIHSTHTLKQCKPILKVLYRALQLSKLRVLMIFSAFQSG
jgi:hypothetical protein